MNNKDEPGLFPSLNSPGNHSTVNERDKVTSIIKVTPECRALLKHTMRKDQRYSDFFIELLEYKKEHEGHIKKEDGYGVNSTKSNTILTKDKPYEGQNP